MFSSVRMLKTEEIGTPWGNRTPASRLRTLRNYHYTNGAYGPPCGIRTRVSPLKGERPRLLDEGKMERAPGSAPGTEEWRSSILLNKLRPRIPDPTRTGTFLVECQKHYQIMLREHLSC